MDRDSVDPEVRPLRARANPRRRQPGRRLAGDRAAARPAEDRQLSVAADKARVTVTMSVEAVEALDARAEAEGVSRSAAAALGTAHV